MVAFSSSKLILVCLITSIVSGCQKESSEYVLRLGSPGTSYGIVVRSVESPVLLQDFNLSMAIYTQFRMTLYYKCADNIKRLTIETIAFSNLLLSSLKAPITGLQKFSGDLTNLPSGNENVMHKYTLGGGANLIHLRDGNNKVLQATNYGVQYSDGEFSWTVLPFPIFSGKNLSQWSYQMAGRRRQLCYTTNNDIKSIEYGTAPSIGIQAKQLKFQIYAYRLYTGYDYAGKFKWVRSVVIGKENTDWYLAPNSDGTTVIIPLHKKFKVRSIPKEIIDYQPLQFRKFNDALESKTSSIRTANITEAKLADERWFQVEPQANGTVRLRPAFDLEKYVAVLRITDSYHVLVITGYRSDLDRYLSFEFEFEFPGNSDYAVKRRPEYPCNPGKSCNFPGEAEDTDLQPSSMSTTTKIPNYYKIMGRY